MSMLKKAEKNIIKIAKDLSDIMEIIKALMNFGNVVFKSEKQREIYFDGISKMRQAIYEKYTQAIADCFLFSGIGGKEMKEFSKKLFKERFNPEDRISVMAFLGQWGNCPSSWKTVDENQLRKEAEEIINKDV